MIDLSRDIHSLSDFKRRTAEFRDRLKKSGRPTVLTVNGKADLVVQDVAAYQHLLELLDRLETLAAVREGLEDVAAGRTRPAREALTELARKHQLNPPKGK